MKQINLESEFESELQSKLQYKIKYELGNELWYLLDSEIRNGLYNELRNNIIK